MIPRRYVSIPHEISALSWPEASISDLEALIGMENVNAIAPGCVQVRNATGEWFTLGDGWVVGISTDSVREVLTPNSLAAFYRLGESSPYSASC
jgi:hypothetical protein